ncbi:MAG: hypothetical protein WA183_01115 [Chthoniobacterales bacterium]|jgi:hypothetical protein
MKFLRLIKYAALMASAVMAAQPTAEGQAANRKNHQEYAAFSIHFIY